VELGGVGIWSGQLRADTPEVADAAAELDELGYTAMWVPGGHAGDVLGDCRRLLDASNHAVVATGILNLWVKDAADVAADHHTLTAAHPRRFLLGVGVSHAVLVDHLSPGAYTQPVRVTRSYLDALDATATPVPHGELALAALGPRMLELARDRTAGAHPYLVPPEHSAIARAALGDERLLLPEQAVALADDADTGRALARQHLSIYLQLPNYANNWRRLGFGEDDLADGGSDRLVDTIVAWGDEAAIAARVQAHLDAGADHVCIQVLTEGGFTVVPRAEWRRLAPALVGLRRPT